MKPLREDIANWLPAARQRLRAMDAAPTFEHVGVVERVGDGVATLSGLPRTRLDELLRFEDGTLGLALRVGEESVGCVLLGSGEKVVAGSRVQGTGEIIRVPVGDGLLGRIVDSTGAPLDDGPPIAAGRRDPIERPAPAIVDRDLVTQPLMTGLTVIDAMIPLGRGQRELIIGDRKTGKTAIAVDTIINQRSSDVICVYAAIGQKSSAVKQVIEAVQQQGAFDRCVFVVGESGAPPGAQWITPYAACTMAEYFRDLGQDALLVIDDLTKHAIVYRELSLLLRKPPGREAYPGDVFYLHARLLERAAKLSDRLGGGSLTALPIAETQAGNLTAYIPTNLISITDGQIYLEPKLFYEGQKPAVNVGMSVSRVGGQTQAPAMKHVAETLKLEYAQFLELEVFTRFGAMVDERTRRTIEHGRRIRAILVQPEHRPVPLAEQLALLLATEEGKLDAVPLDLVERFKSGLGDRLSEHCPRAIARIESIGELSDEDRQDLVAVIDAFLAEIAPGSREDS
ncbi:MAG: F0F1 ATP synthase subunit alpha [Rhodospirillales bacterium]|nr:F0F1 ATP synthase subunit alpha [Rhodospirillales bacterium]